MITKPVTKIIDRTRNIISMLLTIIIKLVAMKLPRVATKRKGLECFEIFWRSFSIWLKTQPLVN